MHRFLSRRPSAIVSHATTTHSNYCIPSSLIDTTCASYASDNRRDKYSSSSRSSHSSPRTSSSYGDDDKKFKNKRTSNSSSRSEFIKTFKDKRDKRDKIMFRKELRTVYLDKSLPQRGTKKLDPTQFSKPIVLPEMRPIKAPDVADILAGHANCPGCGIAMQTHDESKPGYINPSALTKHIEDEETFDRVRNSLVQSKLEQLNNKNQDEDGSGGEETNGVIRTAGEKNKLRKKEAADSNEQLVNQFLDQLLGREPNTVDHNELQTYERMRNQKPITCIRCHQLSNYGKVLSHSITADDFRNQLAKLKSLNALIVVIVDLFDVESSFIPGLGDLIGKNPVLVVGTKVDLLPRGAGMDRVRGWLKKECITKMGLPMDSEPKKWVSPASLKKTRSILQSEEGGNNHYKKARDEEEEDDGPQVRGVVLVSSKTGENIDELVARIEKCRKGRDVYVVGCTNVGKSTLINRLMNDLMPVEYYNTKAKPVREQKSEEIDLSKITDPSQIFKLEVESMQKKKQEQEADKESEKEQKKKEEMDELLRAYGKKNARVLLTTSPVPGTTLRSMSFILENKNKSNLSKKEAISHLYDTPGVINKKLILNHLDQKDWGYLLPTKRIVPHHYRLRPGRSLFLGGLVRIDYESNEGNPQPDWDRLFFSVFASPDIAVHTTNIERAPEIYEKHFGTRMLAPPFIRSATETPENSKRQRNRELKEKQRRKKAAQNQADAQPEAEPVSAEEVTPPTMDAPQEQEPQQPQQPQPHALYGMTKVQTITLRGSTRSQAITDIAIGGVGWISVTGVGNVTLTIHCNKKVHVATRPPLMPFETFKITKDRFIDG